METANCPRCGWMLTDASAPCPNCVQMHEMTLRLREQQAVVPVAKSAPSPTPTVEPIARVPFEIPQPLDPNPAGYRWSQHHGRWMPAKDLDREDRATAAGMCAIFGVVFAGFGAFTGWWLFAAVGVAFIANAIRLNVTR